MRQTTIVAWFMVCCPASAVPPQNASATVETPTKLTLAEQRQRFQSQELIPAKLGGWIIPPGTLPRIIWRDVDEVRRLNGDVDFQVRWFDSDLREFPHPNHPGRWMASISGTAPNGTPLRRAMTFFAIPPDIASASSFDLKVAVPNFPGPQAPTSWRERESEVVRLLSGMIGQALINSEQGAILLSGLFESETLGRPARYTESTSVMNDQLHLALKLQLLGLQGNLRSLQPPRPLNSPATVLHSGTAEQAGVALDAKARIDTVCQAWADDSGEPFVTLVARRGVIVTHRAFGRGGSGAAVPLDYRCWTASLTKTVTALMFSQFLDQRLIDLDAPLGSVFPEFPKNDPHVPTFRQCLNHTSGLTGHGEFGGMKNPHLENIVLNSIDINEPNSRYAYCGLGYELIAKAMEMVSGKCAARLYHDHLFSPLGFGDVVLGNASSDGEFTAMELGILGQWVANEGQYGALEFISPKTFKLLLPQPVRVADGGYKQDEGLGVHWIRHRRSGIGLSDEQKTELLFGARAIGHGSFSGCVFVIDPEQQLVITQVRQRTGARHAEWSPKFFQVIADTIVAE